MCPTLDNVLAQSWDRILRNVWDTGRCLQASHKRTHTHTYTRAHAHKQIKKRKGGGRKKTVQ